MSLNRPSVWLALVTLLVCGAGLAWHFRESPAARALTLFREARRHSSAGEAALAEQSAARAFELDRSLSEAALLAAEAAARQRAFGRALGHLQELQSPSPETALHAALLSADINHHRLFRLSDAEANYRAALEIAPDDPDANRELAQLLGLVARRREAIPHVLRLIRAGAATDLLILLARDDGVARDDALLKAASAANPDDSNLLLAASWHAADDEQLDQALQLTRRALRVSPDFDAAHVRLGQQLLAARRFDELRNWAAGIPPSAEAFPELWVVRGRIAEHERQPESAIRCYWEALRRGPEIKSANLRLAKLLAGKGHPAAERFSDRARLLQELETVQDRVLFSGDVMRVEGLLDLARAEFNAGRLWESRGWYQWALKESPENTTARLELQRLVTATDSLELTLTNSSANPAFEVDFSSYPLPRFESAPAVSVADSQEIQSARLSFSDQSRDAGLEFRYFPGVEGTSSHRMFELTGGGVGVLDYDLDGWPDLFLTQGCDWPPDGADDRHSDRVFRNMQGGRFIDVSSLAGIHETAFGQGISVGDVDADGFPDVYVASIGANCLWRNNGDGTFTNATTAARLGGSRWTTSCVIADLDGDTLPDLYDVNYVTGDDVFDRLCRHFDGSIKMCQPFDFEGETDRLWINRGEGTFEDASQDSLIVAEPGKGLGIAVWDSDGTGRLSALVANDTTPNFFLTSGVDQRGAFLFTDSGLASGVAFSADGKTPGCMGIALGDVNGDGLLDVHITNFLAEPSTFYLAVGPGQFDDRTRETGLYGPSLDVLGFGTQLIDVDNDGTLELFVANGHIDDLSRFGRPYRMPAQLFHWDGRRFSLVSPEELGPYFQEKWLGRPAARIDWNRDGREDLVIGHLEDDTVLLTNTTEAAGRFFSLRLIGVNSSRDAIGTTVVARIGERSLTRQLTAGDGYQASNERRLIFGLGDARQVDELIVRWPSGTEQRFLNVPASQEACLVEGRPPLTIRRD